MERVISAALFVLVIVLGAYALLGFVVLEWDVTAWTGDHRSALAAIAGVAGILGLVAALPERGR